MIHEHKYAFYYWLSCKNFSNSEFEKLVQALQKTELRIINVDGYDYEDHSLCVKVIKYIPQAERYVQYCKKNNAIIGKQFLNQFGKSLGSRLYFNINRGEIKFLNS